MKLRNRTKRVPSNIKQEDCKSDLTAAKPSAVSSTVADTFGQTIKQEDTKDHKKTWLEQDGKTTYLKNTWFLICIMF